MLITRLRSANMRPWAQDVVLPNISHPVITHGPKTTFSITCNCPSILDSENKNLYCIVLNLFSWYINGIFLNYISVFEGMLLSKELICAQEYFNPNPSERGWHLLGVREGQLFHCWYILLTISIHVVCFDFQLNILSLFEDSQSNIPTFPNNKPYI